MKFLRIEQDGKKKYLHCLGLRISYYTEGAGECRKAVIGGIPFTYWRDLEEDVPYVKLFGKRITFRSSRRGKHYQMRDTLTTKKCKKLLVEEMQEFLGYRPNLDRPKTYNEKILWMKLYEQNPLITVCCDKYAVKQYVAEQIGEELAVPTIGVWDDPAKIDFDSLPDKFVLKVNWASGYNIIVKDKKNLDIPKTVRCLANWMQPQQNSYYSAFNWGYKDMKPVVYAETYIEQIDGQVYDYKFCISEGELLYTLIATNRNSDLTKDYFDADFRHIPVQSGGSPHADPLPEKPKHYDRMLEIAMELAKPFRFVRVDFYEVGDTIYLGEMTFYPGGGQLPLTPREWEYTWGEKMPPRES